MVTTSQLLIATIFKTSWHTLSLAGWGYEIFQCRDKRSCPLFTGVHIKWVSVKRGSTVVQKKLKLKLFHLNNYTFWVQRWTLSSSKVLDSEKTAIRSSEAYVKRRLYCFHHHSFIIHHHWLIFPFLRFQPWAMDPPFWTGSMDHLYGPGPWTPCNGPGPCPSLKKKERKKERRRNKQ